LEKQRQAIDSRQHLILTAKFYLLVSEWLYWSRTRCECEVQIFYWNSL